MSLENIANEDMTVTFSNNSGPPDLVYGDDPGIDTVMVVPTKSTTCNAGGKAVCTTGVTVTWTLATGGCPFTSETYDFVSGASSIMPGATKTKADGSLVLRAGDSSESGCVGSWKLKVDPFTVMTCTCSVEIADAGQEKVKAQ